MKPGTDRIRAPSLNAEETRKLREQLIARGVIKPENAARLGVISQREITGGERRTKEWKK